MHPVPSIATEQRAIRFVIRLEARLRHHFHHSLGAFHIAVREDQIISAALKHVQLEVLRELTRYWHALL